MADDKEDYEIGYGRPPRYTRYRKGQSGNPNGRPKKARAETAHDETEFDQMQRRTFDRPVRVKEGGKSVELKAIEAVMRAQVAGAVTGSPISQRDILKSKESLDLRDAERAKAKQTEEQALARDKAESEARLFEYFRDLKHERAREWNAAIAQGKEKPDFPWPHPDDILIDESQRRYRLRGPFSPEDVPFFRWVEAERDVCYLKYIRSHRSRAKSAKAMGEIWLLLCQSPNACLPKSWQIPDGFEHSIETLLEMPLRKLDKMIEDRRKRAEQLSAFCPIRTDDKDIYKIVNGIMQPGLQQCGYHSLAEFERAYEDSNGNLAWPNCQANSA